VHVDSGLAGLVGGLVAGPIVDRIATNAPVRRPLLASSSRSRLLPLVVLGCAALGTACGLVFGLTLEAAIAAVFCWMLVLVTRTDLEHRLIPNRVVIPTGLALLVARTIDDPSVVWLLCALGAGLFLFVFVLVYPSGIGMGDVKLAAAMGAALGTSVAVALFVGFAAAFVPAAVMFARRGRSALKLGIPLGPFLALGGVVALFAGAAILDWYGSAGS
jgi:leader peptidase (prepilin peptidase) / N-methyltransferase